MLEIFNFISRNTSRTRLNTNYLEFTRNNYYEPNKKLKESINKNNELVSFDSIAKFAFNIKIGRPQ